MLDELNNSSLEQSNHWKTIITYNDNQDVQYVVLAFTDFLNTEHRIIKFYYQTDKYDVLNINDILNGKTKLMVLDFLSQDSKEWWGEPKFNLIILDRGSTKVVFAKKIEYDSVTYDTSEHLIVVSGVPNNKLNTQEFLFTDKEIDYYSQYEYKNKSGDKGEYDNSQIKSLKRPVSYHYVPKTSLLETDQVKDHL